jgi:hypothetical protein
MPGPRTPGDNDPRITVPEQRTWPRQASREPVPGEATMAGTISGDRVGGEKLRFGQEDTPATSAVMETPEERWAEAREALGGSAPTILLGTSSGSVRRWSNRLAEATRTPTQAPPAVNSELADRSDPHSRSPDDAVLRAAMAPISGLVYVVVVILAVTAVPLVVFGFLIGAEQKAILVLVGAAIATMIIVGALTVQLLQRRLMIAAQRQRLNDLASSSDTDRARTDTESDSTSTALRGSESEPVTRSE